QVDAGAPLVAQRLIVKDVQPKADRLIDTTLKLIRTDAEQGRVHALAIEQMRSELGTLGVGLAVACSVLSVVVAVLVARNIRRHARVQRAYAQLLADRADELEQFSGRVAHDIASPLFA